MKRKKAIIIVASILTVFLIVLMGVRGFNYHRNLVDVVDDYFKYREVDRVKLDDDTVLLYYYEDGTKMNYAVLKKTWLDYKVDGFGGTYDMSKYRVHNSEELSGLVNHMNLSTRKVDDNTLVCGSIYNNITVEKVVVCGEEAKFINVDENFNVNIRFDLDNVRIFYALIEGEIDETEVVAYDKEGIIVTEHN